MIDITIIGGGPSGLILASACVESGFSVRVLDLDSRKAWTNNYCFWLHEMSKMELSKNLSKIFHESIEHTWDNSTVSTGESQFYTLPTPYAKFNTKRLQETLLGFLDQNAVSIENDVVLSLVHESDRTRIVGERHVYESRIVVDASGSGSQLLPRNQKPEPAYQIAYGQTLHFPDGYDHIWSQNQATFMDFRVPLGWKHFRYSTPSFVYVLPLSPTEVFVEETILATRNTVEYTELQERLRLRKISWMCRDVDVIDEEYCRIEMGGSLPKRGRTLAFGASAGFTHPVTGYQMMRSIYTAPKLANALKESWEDSIDSLTAKAWSVIWSPNGLYNRRLYLLGLDLIARLKHKPLQSFFDAFFSSNTEDILEFLSGFSDPSQVEVSMWNTFKHADMSTKSQIVRASMSHPNSLIQAIFGKAYNLEQS